MLKLPGLYPIGTNENVIIIARTLPSLLEGGVSAFTGAKPQKAAFYVENGMLSAIRMLPPGTDESALLPGQGWRQIVIPPEQFLVPAFVDCHLHLALDGVEGFRTFAAPPAPSVILSRLKKLAAAGVLAVRDGGDQFGSAYGAQKLVADKDREEGPLPWVVPTGPALFRRGYYGAKLGGEGLAGLEGLEREVQFRKNAGAKQLKVILSGLVSLKHPGKVGPLQFNLTELQEIIRLAAVYELPVMAHASSEAAVRLAVQAGVHSVEHGYFLSEESLGEMTAKGITWIPTLAPLAALAASLVASPEVSPKDSGSSAGQQAAVLQYAVEQQLLMLNRARALGTTIAVGTDGGAPGVSWPDGYWMELKLLSKAGYTPGELLSLAAINGADLLNLAKERGYLAPGKPPCWLCLDIDFLAGQIKRRTLKGIVFSSQ